MVVTRPGKYIITAVIILFIIFSVLAAFGSQWKVLAISWVAFASMAGAIVPGIYAGRRKELLNLVIGYGIASGAMITSTALFLIPAAIGYNAILGGLGIAVGVMIGFAIHTLSYDSSNRLLTTDSVIIELITHALTAGVIIGMVYAVQPGFSVLLGVAIISHKAPAGYAAARKLAIKKSRPWLLLLPACAVGLTALPMSLVALPVNTQINALVFGFATGVFLHVAFNFLPGSQTGTDYHKDITGHISISKYQSAAVFSTFLGGLTVFLLWLFTH